MLMKRENSLSYTEYLGRYFWVHSQTEILHKHGSIVKI